MRTILKVEKLSKKYGMKAALKEFSMEIASGEIVALIGENGAGKTTLLNAICDYIHPSSGYIYFKGKKMCSEFLKKFGILIEVHFFDFLSAEENLRYLLRLSSRDANENIIDKLLKDTGLYESRKKKTKAYSFGMKQRLGLCQSLLTKVDFLILDEPFVGLDPIGKELFKKVIVNMAHSERIPVLFSSHDLDDVDEICDRIIMIQNGEKILDQKLVHHKTYCLQVNGNISEKLKSELHKCCGNIEFGDSEIMFQDEAHILNIQKILLEEGYYINGMSIHDNNLKSLFLREVTS